MFCVNSVRVCNIVDWLLSLEWGVDGVGPLLVVISSFISYKLYPQHNGSNIDIDVVIATVLQTIL